MNNLIEMGKILKTKGLDGTVKCEVYTSDYENIVKVKNVFINNEKFSVNRTYMAGGFLYLKFNEIKTIEEGEKLKNKTFYISQADASPLSENETYVKDLIGFEVFKISGEKVGKLVDVEVYAHADLLKINTRREELLLPNIDGLIEKVEDNKIYLNNKLFKELSEYAED